MAGDGAKGIFSPFRTPIPMSYNPEVEEGKNKFVQFI